MKLGRFRFARGALRDGRGRSRETLARFRDERVAAMVRHAYRNVGYYRTLFDAHGVDPGEVGGVADLAKLPISTKHDLQSADPADLIARDVNPSRLIVRRTTGSTGEPLEIRRSWTEERLLGAFRWRALLSMGARLTDRYAEIEETLVRDPNDHRFVHDAFERLGLLRQVRIDALAHPDEIANRLRAFSPSVIGGYAGVVTHLADVARDRVEQVRPRLVVLHSDTLTPRMRAAVQSAFAAPVYEIYDSNEVNVIAAQCVETGNLHVSDDTVVVEVLVDDRPAEPGESGDVVLTSLHSWSMPFVRYQIGDLVTCGSVPCGCGRPFSTLRAVRGRMFDYFPLVDGRTVHPYEIINVLERGGAWLVRYRITQEARERLVLELLARASPPDGTIERVQRDVVAVVGPGVEVVVRLVESLPFEGTAKLRVCRSLVASEYDEA